MSAGVVIGIVLLALIIILISTGFNQITPFENLREFEIDKMDITKLGNKKVISRKEDISTVLKYLRTIMAGRTDPHKLEEPVYSINIITTKGKELDVQFLYTKFHYVLKNVDTGEIEVDRWYSGNEDIVKQLQKLYDYVL